MKEEQAYKSVVEVFTTYIKKRKLRKTPERFAILKFIFDHEGHFDAESLYSDMKKEYRVSLATVYNTLELLLDCGLIIKHPFVCQMAQYEKTFGNVIHSHLVCTKCGAVKEFTDKKMRKTIQSKTFLSFDISHYSLYLYGLCKACRASKKKNSK